MNQIKYETILIKIVKIRLKNNKIWAKEFTTIVLSKNRKWIQIQNKKNKKIKR